MCMLWLVQTHIPIMFSNNLFFETSEITCDACDMGGRRWPTWTWGLHGQKHDHESAGPFSRKTPGPLTDLQQLSYLCVSQTHAVRFRKLLLAAWLVAANELSLPWLHAEERPRGMQPDEAHPVELGFSSSAVTASERRLCPCIVKVAFPFLTGYFMPSWALGLTRVTRTSARNGFLSLLITIWDLFGFGTGAAGRHFCSRRKMTCFWTGMTEPIFVPGSLWEGNIKKYQFTSPAN